MRKGVSLIAAIGLVALAVGAYWWVTSNKELMWALTRGSANKTSSSTEPYEVALRIASRNGLPFPEGEKTREWILRIPRTFVTRENGTNGVVDQSAGSDEDYYSTSIALNVDEDGISFTPSVGKTRDQLVLRSIIVRLRNAEASIPLRTFDLCVPQDKDEEILKSFGYRGYSRSCSDIDLRCEIATHIDGWWLNIAVTQDLYANPNQACAFARMFLDQHTIKRDDLRESYGGN
jgi:hypothetical protein